MKKILLLIVLIAIMVVIFTQIMPLEPAVQQAAEERTRLSTLLSADPDEGFEMATAGRQFRFPADHGPHPRFRNEWWYLTGNLDGEDGRRFGYEVTFFRFSLAPEQVEAASRWQTRQVYIAHFAVTDAHNEAFYVAERYSRAAVGLAGARSDPFTVWIDDWSVRKSARDGDEQWLLRAADEDMALELALEAEKAPVLNGRNGLSQKSATAGNASYYYSVSRLRTSGNLQLGGETYAVTGLSWLDREWSSSALGADQQGWDWFALQLSDGSDLMFLQHPQT